MLLGEVLSVIWNEYRQQAIFWGFQPFLSAGAVCLTSFAFPVGRTVIDQAALLSSDIRGLPCFKTRGRIVDMCR